MTGKSVSQMALDLVAGAERWASGDDTPRGEFVPVDVQMNHMLSAPVRSFQDVRALIWLAHCQMEAAAQAPNQAMLQASLQRSRHAAMRVADELGVLSGPPRDGETQ